MNGMRHRDTEGTQKTQRRSKMEDRGCRRFSILHLPSSPCRSLCPLCLCVAFRLTGVHMRKLIALIVGICFGAPALAVGTSHWNHTSEADFKEGTFHNVVATNLGDLKLSRAVKMLLGSDAEVSAVYALAEGPDGTVYAGTGPQGVLLAIRKDKVNRIAKL